MAMRDLIPWSRQQSSSPAHYAGEMSPFVSFRREIDRLFDDMFRSPTFGLSGSAASWPNIEVEEDDNQVRVTAEMPGLTEKDVELRLDRGMLTIRGEKKREREERGYSERWYGRFDRQLALPFDVDEEQCRAEFRDGLLTVTLPKSEQARNARKIPINAETRH